MALQALTLRFENQLGQRLSASQASDLFAALLVYVNNGDGLFSPTASPCWRARPRFPSTTAR